MKKIRLGNDFILKLILYKVDNQLVLDNDGNPIGGTPEDLTNAKNVTLKLYNINYRKEYNIVKSINVNIIQSEILSNIQQIGKHYILLEYDQDNLEFESGYQHFKIGLYSFEILSQNSNIETVDQVVLYSCVSSGGGSGNIDLSEYVTDNELESKLSLYSLKTEIPDLSGFSKNEDLALKVDKITGKGLSTNDYTTEEKNKLQGISINANNYVHPSIHSADILVDGTTNKVFTATEKTKLSGIATGAEVNVQSDWNATSGDAFILNKPTTVLGYGITDAYTKTEVDNKLSTVYKYKGVVATSSNLPSTGMVVGDVWNVTDTNINYAWDGSVWDPLGGAVGADVSLATPTTDGLLSASDFVKLSGIEASANNYTHPATHSADMIVDGTTNKAYTGTEKSKLAGISAGADVSVNPDWNATSGKAQILNKPTTISGYGINDVHSKEQIDALLQERELFIAPGTSEQYFNGDKIWKQLNKESVGLSNVDNTSDYNKPISQSTQNALDSKSDLSHSHSPEDILLVMPISKGGTGLSEIGQPNQILKVNALGNGLEYASTSESSSGTVTSVSMTVPTGLTVTGSPVTTAGTFSVTLASGYSIPTTMNQTNWNTAYSWGNHAGLYQPIDADLTAIAALSETSGLLKKTVADTWTLDTTSYATTSALDGKVDKIAGKGLSTEDFTSGLLTKLNGIAAGAEVNVQPNWLATEGDSLILNKPTTLLGYGITDAQAKSNDLTAIDALSGTNGFLKKTAVDTWSLDTSTYLTGNQTITLSGAITGSGTTAITTSYNTVVPTTKGGTGLSTIGTAGQYLAVNSGATALEWVTSRDKDVNTVTTLASLPITKRLVTATVTAATTISLASALAIGDELHIIVYNNSGSIITQTLPNTGSFISLSGTSISIPAGGRVEINILCYATTSYLIRAL